MNKQIREKSYFTAGKLRTFFGFFFPITLSILIILIYFQARTSGFNRTYNQHQKKWKNNAAILLESLKSYVSFSDSFKKAENRLTARIKFDLANQLTYQTAIPIFKSEFSNYLSHPKSRLWLFKTSKTGFKSLKGPELTKRGFRVMEKVVGNLWQIKTSNFKNQLEKEKAFKFIRSVLGAKAAPQFLGADRQGQLTPIRYKKEHFYIYWKVYQSNKKTLGAAVLLVPLSLKKDLYNRLRKVAQTFYLQMNKRFAVGFVPNKHLADDLSIILPQTIENLKKDQYYKNSIEKAYKHFLEHPNDETFKYDKHIFIKGNLAIEFPYDFVLFSLEPIISKPILAPYLFGIFMIWILIYSYSYYKTGKFGLPLEISFKVLFFLVGLFPIALLLSLGIEIIEEDFQLSLKRKEHNGIQELRLINEKSSLLMLHFREAIREFISDPRNQQSFTTDSKEDLQTTFNRLRANLINQDLTLNALFSYMPGQKSQAIYSSEKYKSQLSTNFDLYANSIVAVNKRFHAYSKIKPQINLTEKQKGWAAIIDQLGRNKFLPAMFRDLSEKVNFFQLGEDTKNFFTGFTMQKGAAANSYIVFGADSSLIYKPYVQRELNNLNANNEITFSYLHKNQESLPELYPSRNNKLWSSKSGKTLKKILESCKSSDKITQIATKENLYICYPMEKVQNFISGCVIPLNKINNQKQFKMFALYLTCIFLAGIMYLLSSSISNYMIHPLKKVNSKLIELSQGNFNISFEASRSDEIGRLNTTLNTMVDGFKERKALGKFVSTTFETYISKPEENIINQKNNAITGTLLFSDIRNFTTISEAYPPDIVVEMLNTHLEEMVSIIHKYDGKIEQFIGDAIVCVFLDDDKTNSQITAIEAAIEMMKQHKKVQQKRQRNGQFTYGIGIGLDHGEMLSMTLTTAKRSVFSILGSPRTNAEKLETLSKKGNFTKIIISENLSEKASQYFKLVALSQYNCFEIQSLEKKA